MPKSLFDLDPSRGLLRVGLHLPIVFYRLHMGWLLGNRFLMLTHIGRITGTPHKTVLEVVDYDNQTGVYVIASGWREKSDWYRNLQKTPQVTVNVGRKQFRAITRQLTSNDAETVLVKYAEKYPLAFRELARLIIGKQGEDVEGICHFMALNIPLIALEPNK